MKKLSGDSRAWATISDCCSSGRILGHAAHAPNTRDAAYLLAHRRTCGKPYTTKDCGGKACTHKQMQQKTSGSHFEKFYATNKNRRWPRYSPKCEYYHAMAGERTFERTSCFRSFSGGTGGDTDAGKYHPMLGGNALTPVKCSSTVKLRLLQCTGCDCIKRYQGRATQALVRVELDHHLNTIKGQPPMVHCQPWFIYVGTDIPF